MALEADQRLLFSCHVGKQPAAAFHLDDGEDGRRFKTVRDGKTGNRFRKVTGNHGMASGQDRPAVSPGARQGWTNAVPNVAGLAKGLPAGLIGDHDTA